MHYGIWAMDPFKTISEFNLCFCHTGVVCSKSFLKNCWILNFYHNIWCQHEKYIPVSTNKPSIGSVIKHLEFSECESILNFENAFLNDNLLTFLCQHAKHFLFPNILVYLMLNAGHGQVKIWSYFLTLQGTISRMIAPILGLFVLIRMHFSFWI